MMVDEFPTLTKINSNSNVLKALKITQKEIYFEDVDLFDTTQMEK
jgi:hypothetical protein